MNAEGVRAALRARWDAEAYLVAEEVASTPDRQGGKIDLVAISYYRSRGLALEAVEIKVSVSDFRAEIRNPAKADWWWEHSDRFWLAIPADLRPKIEDDVPPSWGIITVSDAGRATTRRAAPARGKAKKPLDWPATVALLRTASGAGRNALYRAEQEGRRLGAEEARRNTTAALLEREHAALIEKVDRFAELTGIDLRKRYGVRDVEETARLFSFLNAFRHDPAARTQPIRHAAETLRSEAKRLDEIVDRLEEQG